MESSTCLFIKHVPFEGPGVIESWALERNFETRTEFARTVDASILCDADLLVIMGGPYGVSDADRLPWFRKEHEAIGERTKSGAPTIGVCLGAQLLSSALGGEVTTGRSEIGWHDVAPGTYLASIEGFDRNFEAFHWHGDTFSLPPGGLRLFSSEACGEQGFLYERNLALQFHLEVDIDGVDALIKACAGDLANSNLKPYVQSEQQIRKSGDITAMHRRLFHLLDWYLDDVVG